MKYPKLLGLSLISSAILLQVGYAANVVQNHPVVNTGGFDVYFEDVVSTVSSDYIEVVVSEKDSTLDIKVKNIYPGANFNIETYIKNNGNITAQIKNIALKSKDPDKSWEFMNMLVGYGMQGEVCEGEEAYNDYLQKTYIGHQLNQNESMPLKFSLGMNPEIEGLQNEIVEFSIEIGLEQVISPGGGGGGDGDGSDSGGDEPDTDDQDQDPDSIIPDETIPGGAVTDPDIIMPDEAIPGGGVNPDVAMPDEAIPGGGVNPDVAIPDEGIPGGGVVNADTTILDETIPGGGMLPKTGGITPTLVYTIGFAMLAGGVVIYRKKE